MAGCAQVIRLWNLWIERDQRVRVGDDSSRPVDLYVERGALEQKLPFADLCGGLGSCAGGVMTCDARACSATCSGGGSSLAALACGSSCDCVDGC